MARRHPQNELVCDFFRPLPPSKVNENKTSEKSPEKTEPPFVVGGGKTKNPAGLVSHPCQKGYQSHYVEVTHEGYPVKAEGLDVKDNLMVGIYSDELVLFEGSQTLPLFLVYSTQYGGSGGGGSEHDKVTTGLKGWDFLNQSIGDADKVGADDETATPQG